MRLILALALLSAACGSASPSAETVVASNAVTGRGRAIDGDTVAIDFRLFGADAFEKRQLCRTETGCWQCGKAAQDYAARLLKSGDATIRITGAQSYGRPVGVVSIQGQDLGEAMIAAGFAVPATSFLKRDPDRATRYVDAYNRAARAHAGVHAGFFIDPAKWRRGERLSCERPDQDRENWNR